MNTRVLNAVLGLIALGAISFAGYLYISQSKTPLSTSTPTPTASTLQEDSATSSPTPATTETTTTATPRIYSETQALSIPNDIQEITPGDSLSSIAQSRGMSVNELAQLNGITDPNKVLAGQKIIVPDDVSGDTFVILFALNANRLKKEEQKLTSGMTSLYSDPITAAQTDIKGIYNLGADTPFSKSNEAASSVNLSTSGDNKITTISMEKHASGVWFIKRVSIKISQAGTP